MKIERVAEHSFCPELMPEGAKVLDLGCLGFVFKNEMIRRGYWVYAVDIQYLEGGGYTRLGITDYDGVGLVLHNSDKQAATLSGRLKREGEDHIETVECETLKTFSRKMDVEFWDLIKMDVEGSEKQIIMSLTEPPAKQLSIEFHLHTGIYDIQMVTKMRLKLFSLGYIAVQHELTEEHGCGLNFWDSVFVLQ